MPMVCVPSLSCGRIGVDGACRLHAYMKVPSMRMWTRFVLVFAGKGTSRWPVIKTLRRGDVFYSSSNVLASQCIRLNHTKQH